MTKRMVQDWPLAAFTVLLQVAAGLAIGTVVSMWIEPSGGSAWVRIAGTAVFPVIVTGLLISLLHLGRPASAWRAVANSVRSRLSREVVLAGVFSVCGFLYSAACYLDAVEFRMGLGWAASVFGILTVLASAAVYRIPSRPVWNTRWVPTSFLGATLAIGGFTVVGCTGRMGPGMAVAIIGVLTVLTSGIAMYRQAVSGMECAAQLKTATGVHALIVVVATLMLFVPTGAAAQHGTTMIASCILIADLLLVRVVMFALGELEPRF